MKVVQLDSEGFFCHETFADQSPLEDGVFLIPGGCVVADAPNTPDGYRAKWSDGWVFVPLPTEATEPEPEPEPEPAPLTYAEKRLMEYPSFTDQFDLLYHGGYDAWKAAIQTVKAKYPKE